ncbi:MAG: hypothetical protein H0W88_06350 [Parachlamydiaceae bacterium]|nr:hypothetical protein [Parachlamydiaceae bacterium]
MDLVLNQNLPRNIIPAIKTQLNNITPLQKNVLLIAIPVIIFLALAKTLHIIYNMVKLDDDPNVRKPNEVFKKILQTPITEVDEKQIKHVQVQPENLVIENAEELETTQKQVLEPTIVKRAEILVELEPSSKSESLGQSPKIDTPGKEVTQVEVLNLKKTIDETPNVETSKTNNPSLDIPVEVVETPKSKLTILPDGSEVEGELVEVIQRKLQGKGKIKLKNGTVHEGIFKDGLLHGIGQSTEEGLFYDGFFVEGKLHGKGTIRNLNSIIILKEGKFIKGELIEGTSLKDGVTYIGMFLNGVLVGKGVKILPNGDRYEGNFKDNKLFGGGKILRKNNTTIEGVFKDDVKIETPYIYFGKDKDGMYSTQYQDGLVMDRIFVEGTWEYGMSSPSISIGKFDHSTGLVGMGLKIENGTRQEGKFQKNSLEGIGRIIYANGDLLEGTFENDKIVKGYGKFITHTGVVSLR